VRREQRTNYYLQLLENSARPIPSHNRNPHQLHNAPAPVAHANLQLCPPYFNTQEHAPHHAGNLKLGQSELQSGNPNPVKNEPDWKLQDRKSLPLVEEALTTRFAFKTNPVRFAETHVFETLPSLHFTANGSACRSGAGSLAFYLSAVAICAKEEASSRSRHPPVFFPIRVEQASRLYSFGINLPLSRFFQLDNMRALYHYRNTMSRGNIA